MDEEIRREKKAKNMKFFLLKKLTNELSLMEEKCVIYHSSPLVKPTKFYSENSIVTRSSVGETASTLVKRAVTFQNDKERVRPIKELYQPKSLIH